MQTQITDPQKQLVDQILGNNKLALALVALLKRMGNDPQALAESIEGLLNRADEVIPTSAEIEGIGEAGAVKDAENDQTTTLYAQKQTTLRVCSHGHSGERHGANDLRMLQTPHFYDDIDCINPTRWLSRRSALSE
jgi:sugar/nucleoside kinase (ribokinase family)